MDRQTKNTIEKREKRFWDTISHQEPDRVPFIPQVGKAYTQSGDVSNYDAAMDVRNLKGAVRNFLTRYEVDLFNSPPLYPIRVLEALGSRHVKWPGARHGLDMNALHQIVDKGWLEEDEYDAFLRDPTNFIFTRVFPDKHGNLNGLRKLILNEIVELNHISSFSAFADPEVRATLLTLMIAGEEVRKWEAACAELAEVARETGCPVLKGALQTTAYDMFADNLRGYLNVPMDIFTIPGKVMAAVEYMQGECEAAIRRFAKDGVQVVLIPLHGGMDDFMSNETYLKFYWPFLQKMICLIADLGMIAHASCEGRYNNRLDIIKEVPKNKVIYTFENVDMQLAKKTLGGIATIAGLVSSTDLAYGKKEDVIEQTKRCIDICAPGGGFIMNCSMSLDLYNEENMDAWYQTTLQYGRYK